jgi:hypothetical protein
VSDYSTSSTRSWRFELRATPTAAGPSRSAARRRSSRDGELDPVDQAAGVEAVRRRDGLEVGPVLIRRWRAGGRSAAPVDRRTRTGRWAKVPPSGPASHGRGLCDPDTCLTSAPGYKGPYPPGALRRCRPGMPCHVRDDGTGRQGRQGQPEFCPAASGLRQGGHPGRERLDAVAARMAIKGSTRWPTRIGCEGRSATKRPMLQARSCHL